MSTADRVLDYDLLRIRIENDFKYFCESFEGLHSMDKINNAMYILERLVDIEIPPAHEMVNPYSSSLAYLQTIKRQLILIKHEVYAGLGNSLPHESAILYERLFPTVAGPEAEEYQKRWDEAYSHCVKRGGPWKHHTCGETFPMPPGHLPICPKCDIKAWRLALEAYGRESSARYQGLQDQIAAAAKAAEEESKISYGINDEWNSVCAKCGAQAYEGLELVICKNGCV